MDVKSALSAMTRYGLDGYFDGCFHGWVWDLLQPDIPRLVSISCGGVEVVSGSADVHRDDLESARLGSGACAFVLEPALSPVLLAGGLEFSVNGLALAIPDDARASTELSLREHSLARYAGILEPQAAQLDGETFGVVVRPDAALDPSVLLGLALEVSAAGQRIGNLMPVPGRSTALPVPAEFGATDGGSTEIEVDLVMPDGARLPLHRVTMVWEGRKPELAGWVDGVSDGRLQGWLVDKSHPARPLTARLYVDDVLIGETPADLHRADLTRADLGTTRCAFSLRLPPEVLDGHTHSVAVYCVEWQTFLGGIKPDHVFPRPAVPNRLGAPRASFVLKTAAPRVSGVAGTLFPSGEVAVASDHWPRLEAAYRQVGRLTVVVPVYNAFDDLVDCVNALLASTDPTIPIIVIDDGSTDPRVGPFLASFAQIERVKLITHPTNLGYTQAVNTGIAACAGDVILLNSDTRVTPGWIGNLIAARAEHPRVGTVTAISNNAGAFSVPEAGSDNRMPLVMPDYMISMAFAYSANGPLAVGTGNGFCMLISRDMIDDVGGFDIEAYPQGYGEENDLAMRALGQGWRHLVTDAAFVFHKRSASFRELGGRDEIYAKSQQRLRNDHPYYLSYVLSLGQEPIRTRLHGSKKALVASLNSGSGRSQLRPHLKPRVLIMLHYLGEGGTTLTTLDLCRYLSREFEVFLLGKEGSLFRLTYFNPKHLSPDTLFETQLTTQPRFIDLYDEEYASMLATLLRRWKISLVHIRHLMDHSRIAPRVIRSMGIRYLVSLHDFYSICPTVTLVNAEGRYCAGDCASGERDCADMSEWASDLGRLRGTGVHVWRRAWRGILEHAHAVITTSPTAAGLFDATFGPAVRGRLRVIEHGRDFPEQQYFAQAPEPGGRIRIVMLGNLLTRSKGFSVVRELFRIDRGRHLEFHFVGPAPQEAADIGVVHGRYERDQLAEIIERIRPAFVGILSIWPETYCHTLSESWAMGIPAIVSNLGATGERVQAHGGGISVDPTQAEETYRAIRAASEPDRYEVLLREASISNLRSLEEMGQDYVDLYRSALGQPVLSDPPGAETPTVDQAGAAWLAQRHWAPRRGHAGLAGPLDRGESPSDAAPVTVEEAAVLVSARRVARWMRVWRPRSRTVRERVLFFGGADTAWPDVADTSARMTMRFDADEQAREVARVHGYSEGIGVQPELFDALIERICAEIYLADRIVLLASTPPMVALAAVGAIDALQGSLSGWTGEIESAAAEPWLPPVDDQWAPQAYTESDHAQLLSAKLEAALSVPLAAL